MPRAVIFDVDGTLVDSVDLHAQAWKETFHHFGFEFSFDDVRQQIGKGGDTLIPSLLSPADSARYQKALSKYRDELFRHQYLHRVRAFPAVRELFERCRARGLKVALASSGKEKEVERYVDVTGIRGLFEDRTSADDAERSKPHPDIFNAALKSLGSPRPEDVVVIGDTPYDAEAAGKTGLRAVGVLCGGFPEAQLRAAGCIDIFQDPADLLARFDESPLAEGAPFPARVGGLQIPRILFWMAVAGGATILAWRFLRKSSAPVTRRARTRSRQVTRSVGEEPVHNSSRRVTGVG